MRLRRDSPEPLYVQLKAKLLEEITAGRYHLHQRLPSEREFSERFQVSRMTVRQALLELARDGVIYTRIGKGTFVAEPKIDQPLRAVTSFSQDVQARGSKPASRVLEARVVAATPDIAAALRLLPNDDVILLSRLRLADHTPLAIETAYLPFHLLPKLLRHNFAVESLYSVLEHEYKITLTQAEQHIEAALASPREMDLLKLSHPAAVLHIHRLTLASDGVPVEYVFSTYRGDRYKFRSTLQPRAQSG